MAFLTKAQAQARAERLANHIRKYGVKVVIDLRTGAGGNHWGVDTHIGAMAHHIVSRRSQGLTPFYSLVRNGRSDVPGPLCNIYGGWDMVARIVTMGLANHPGKGGPWVISGRRIPRDNGRYYFLGTEFEGGLREADWTPDYRRFMGAVNAGKLDYLRETSGLDLRDTALCEHSDWARPKGRKIDRLNYTQAKGIAEMQAARARIPAANPGGGTGGGVSLPGFPNVPTPKPTPTIPEGLTVSDISKILDGLRDIPQRVMAQGITLNDAQRKALATGRDVWRLDQLLATLTHRIGLTFTRTATIQAEVDGLTEAVMAIGEVSGMDRAQVQQIVTDTVQRAKVSLDITEED